MVVEGDADGVGELLASSLAWVGGDMLASVVEGVELGIALLTVKKMVVVEVAMVVVDVNVVYESMAVAKAHPTMSDKCASARNEDVEMPCIFSHGSRI